MHASPGCRSEIDHGPERHSTSRSIGALDAPGATLSLHLWTDTWQQDRDTARALRAEYDALLAHLKAVCPPCSWKGAAAEADWRRHYRVHTVWEYWSDTLSGGVWKPLTDVTDETRALTLSGFVQFSLRPSGISRAPASG